METKKNSYANKDATVVLCRCHKSGSLYGIRAERIEKDTWSFTWSFKLKENYAKREGYENNSVSGKIVHDSDFPGCPYCGSMSWFQCNVCGKLTCIQPEIKYVQCSWCGDSGECQVAESFDISGIDY